MLNRESQSFDLQKGRLAEQTININAQRMSSEFGVEASTKAPKGMGMIDFNVELIGKLCVHSFDHLAHRVEKALCGTRQLFLLIATRNRFELNSILFP